VIDMELMDAKGVRNYLPEEMIFRQDIVDGLRKIFEKYGYSPLETPAIERLDMLTAKFAGGEEILKEIFKMKDQGDRDLGLRYDLTVPMSKVVGMNPNINMPFRRYQIQPVWRDGPIKLGRYREFLQCDVDIVGVKSMIADAEILAIASEVFSSLGFMFVIKINNRKLMNGLLDCAGFGEFKMRAILSIDKLAKIGVKGVREELLECGFDRKEIGKLLRLLKTKGRNEILLKRLRNIMESTEGQMGIAELEDLLRYSKSFGVKNLEVDISLARGLEYYTGPVYEVYSKELSSSLAGGGRYDEMIGGFIGRGDFPATGISFGIEPIIESLRLKKKSGRRKTTTKLYVIPIKTQKESMKITKKLRSLGIPAEMDLLERGISKNLSYANSLGIPYVAFVGKNELKRKKIKLRDMKTGKEKDISIEKLKNFPF
jgi:histidyl-tRNA synthetase